MVVICDRVAPHETKDRVLFCPREHVPVWIEERFRPTPIKADPATVVTSQIPLKAVAGDLSFSWISSYEISNYDIQRLPRD